MKHTLLHWTRKANINDIKAHGHKVRNNCRPTFQRYVLPPSSGKLRSTIILHGSTSQKTILNFIFAAVRTWNLIRESFEGRSLSLNVSYSFKNVVLARNYRDNLWTVLESECSKHNPWIKDLTVILFILELHSDVFKIQCKNSVQISLLSVLGNKWLHLTLSNKTWQSNGYFCNTLKTPY
jgi:hypothetical protein